jgi:uncharacterized protein YbcV (DUF1398 family)
MVKMNEPWREQLAEYTRLSYAGELTFPVFVGKLSELGVERYHTDYCREENTYYCADGRSHVVAVPHPQQAIGDTFKASDIEAAVRQSQRNEHTYQDFIRKTKAAGCVGYLVQIAGRRALYLGRLGEVLTEPFPAAPRD